MLVSMLSVSAQVSNGLSPRAVLSFNSDKMGEVNINYNTSFMIVDYNLDEVSKTKVQNNIVQKDASIKEIKISDVEQKKGMHVAVNLFAKDKVELTKKIRFILSEIGVSQVEYNGVVYKTLSEFNF